uniref:Uncharacterized protein n=1 Tax=Manihot esculenta TaxID=3983 RepID=A0A2C9VAD6_MANES
MTFSLSSLLSNLSKTYLAWVEPSSSCFSLLLISVVGDFLIVFLPLSDDLQHFFPMVPQYVSFAFCSMEFLWMLVPLALPPPSKIQLKLRPYLDDRTEG